MARKKKDLVERIQDNLAYEGFGTMVRSKGKAERVYIYRGNVEDGNVCGYVDVENGEVTKNKTPDGYAMAAVMEAIVGKRASNPPKPYADRCAKAIDALRQVGAMDKPRLREDAWELSAQLSKVEEAVDKLHDTAKAVARYESETPDERMPLAAAIMAGPRHWNPPRKKLTERTKIDIVDDASGDVHTCTLADFLANNEDDPEAEDAAKRILRGDASVKMGGGATPLVTIRPAKKHR